MVVVIVVIIPIIARNGTNSLNDVTYPCSIVDTDHTVHDSASIPLRLLLSLTLPANNDAIENTKVNPSSNYVSFSSSSRRSSSSSSSNEYLTMLKLRTVLCRN